ncbi:MAG: hypothetical protein KGY78_10350, partial [Anaerolineae bacterium]|nr:hypothetical protein [Anaerolineae bacterium]
CPVIRRVQPLSISSGCDQGWCMVKELRHCRGLRLLQTAFPGLGRHRDCERDEGRIAALGVRPRCCVAVCPCP